MLEFDCNENQSLDVCDIDSGGSLDTNGNGIPDECEGDCPADLNGNGAVEASDLAELLGSWGPNPGHPADFNDDGLVNATDATVPYEARSSVSILVDLWAPWCGPCRVIGPVLENLSKEYAGRIKVVKVNVDENPGLSQQFGATSIPTMLVIKDGRVVDRIVGALPPNDLKMRLFPYLMKS